MNRTVIMTLLVLGAGLALAQAPAAPSSSPTTLAAGAKMSAELKSKLDTSHARVGDQVKAVTTADVKDHGRVVLPKGSTLTGHVTTVSKASGHSAARIGVLFDHAVTKQGHAVPLRAGIASVVTGHAAAATNGGMNDGMMASSAMGESMNSGMAMPMPSAAPAGAGLVGGAAGAINAGGGLLGGAGATAAGAVNATSAAPPAALPSLSASGAGMANAAGGLSTAGRASHGAPLSIALPSVPQSSAMAGASSGNSAAMGSVLSSSQGNFKLNSGTHMQLQQLGPAPAAAGASASGSAAAHAR